MNTESGTIHDEHKHEDRKHEPGRAIAATFESREEARQAIANLHKAHFTHTWYGVTSIANAGNGEQALTVEDAKPGFFSAKAQNLVDALVAHGVLGDTARSIEADLDAGQAVVTVEPRDKDASEALQILEECGGRVTGSTNRGAFQAAGDDRAYGRTVRSEFDSTDAFDDEEIFYQSAR